MREAPSIDLIQSIVKAGGEVSAYDPKSMDEAKFYLKDGTILTVISDEGFTTPNLIQNLE